MRHWHKDSEIGIRLQISRLKNRLKELKALEKELEKELSDPDKARTTVESPATIPLGTKRNAS
jgi:prefoldin subunit 5